MDKEAGLIMMWPPQLYVVQYSLWARKKVKFQQKNMTSEWQQDIIKEEELLEYLLMNRKKEEGIELWLKLVQERRGKKVRE